MYINCYDYVIYSIENIIQTINIITRRNQMKVSIIMPTYNKSAYLNLTLSGFVNQSYKNFEIIIVNDGSSDQTEEVVYKYKYLINIIYIYQENKGRAAARNSGLANATGEIIIFCDDDRIPDNKFINNHICILENDDKIVTIGKKKEICSIFKRDFTYLPSFMLEMLKKKSSLIDNNLYDDIVLFTPNDVINNMDKVIDKFILLEPADNFSIVWEAFNETLMGFHFSWAIATTANLGIRRMHLKNIIFDENYREWGMEDTDFAYALYQSGCKFYLAKQAVNYHQSHKKDNNYHKSLKRNLIYFNNKYNNVETILFSLLLNSNISIIELNKIYEDICKIPDNIVYVNYINLIRLFVLSNNYVNENSLS